jgi:hypothetical protein
MLGALRCEPHHPMTVSAIGRRVNSAFVRTCSAIFCFVIPVSAIGSQSVTAHIDADNPYAGIRSANFRG